MHIFASSHILKVFLSRTPLNPIQDFQWDKTSKLQLTYAFLFFISLEVSKTGELMRVHIGLILLVLLFQVTWHRLESSFYQVPYFESLSIIFVTYSLINIVIADTFNDLVLYMVMLYWLDIHGTAIATLAALFATALLASFGLLGVVIYYRRQR